MKQNLISAGGWGGTTIGAVLTNMTKSDIIFYITVLSGLVTIIYTLLNIHHKFVKPALKRRSKTHAK